MIEASQRSQLLDVPNHTHSKPCTAPLLLLQHLGLSRSWPEKKQPSFGQRKANKIRWRKNINKTNGNFFRKKKNQAQKKNSQRRQLRDSPTNTQLANSPYTLLH